MIATATKAAYGVLLRSVEPSDAAFIIQQRQHPRAQAFLGDTSSSVDAQQEWINAQRARPNDYYYVAEGADGVLLGTIGLYNFESECAEWGRFVIRPGSKAAPAALLHLWSIAFEQHGLGEVVCTTVASNAHAIAFYERAGMVQDVAHKGHVTLQGVSVATVRHRLKKAEWPAARVQLCIAAKHKQADLVRQDKYYFSADPADRGG